MNDWKPGDLVSFCDDCCWPDNSFTDDEGNPLLRGSMFTLDSIVVGDKYADGQYNYINVSSKSLGVVIAITMESTWITSATVLFPEGIGSVFAHELKSSTK